MAQSDRNKGQGILSTLLIVMVGQVGCLTLVIVGLSVVLGLWLDGTFGTKPLFTLILLLAGIPLSVILMLVISRKTLARLKKQAESSETDTD
jgi:F0F1-type ATP synthase assembly protein I